MSRHAYWIASLLFAAMVLAKFSPQTGFTSLIRFGATWQDRRHSALQNLPVATAPASNGYDGQFYAQIALDPLLRSTELKQVLDAPAYRARRILVPATAAVLGVGHPWWTLQAYALLNIGCWFVLAWLLRRSFGEGCDWIAFARWGGCMFSMGALESVRLSVVDLPALLLLVLAIHAHRQSRGAKSILWLALAGLSKETSLLGAVGLQAEKPFDGRRVLISLSLATTPLIIWSAYVSIRLDDPAAANGMGNFSWPLLGLLTQIKYSLREMYYGNFDGRYSFGLLAILGFLVQMAVLWRTSRPESPWWRIGLAYSFLFLFLGFWVWSGYWAVCRVVLPMTIAFNLLLPANSRFWPLWGIGNVTLLHAVWRFL